jgi:glucose dehydrogenase|tara:strand:- start:55 stop:282 length:228 start_codon:yes stop_codon:yes gene_type:complete
MATAGDLVFQGTEGSGFDALHAENGETLFRHEAPRTIHASSLTYEVDGKQYVTVVATSTLITLALPERNLQVLDH